MTPDDRVRTAVLGTGRMGTAIASRLAEVGVPLVLWNRTAARAAALGYGRVAASPADAVSDAEVVISCLSDSVAVRAAYLGTGGALEHPDGRLFIEMSTAGTDVPRELHEAAVAGGGRVVDAPILAPPALVRAGTAAIIAGGDPGDVARATKVLAALGSVRHVGPVGSGARLKLVANAMLGVLTLAAAELQVAGEQAALDPDDVFFVLQRHVPALGSRRAGYVDDVHEPVTFALRDLAKDMDLAIGLFAVVSATTPLLRTAADSISRAAAREGTREITAVARQYRSGIQAVSGDRRP